MQAKEEHMRQMFVQKVTCMICMNMTTTEIHIDMYIMFLSLFTCTFTCKSVLVVRGIINFVGKRERGRT